MKEKKCTGCDGVKDISNFHKNKSKKDGLCTYCKSCSKEYMLSYRVTNHERLNQYGVDYYKRKMKELRYEEIKEKN